MTHTLISPRSDDKRANNVSMVEKFGHSKSLGFDAIGHSTAIPPPTWFDRSTCKNLAFLGVTLLIMKSLSPLIHVSVRPKI